MHDEFKRRKEDRELLKNRLATEHGVTGNPRLDKCFDIAWEYGHAYGNHEVEIHFSELVELIK